MTKTTLHTRSKHRDNYDFEALCTALPELKPLVITAENGEQTIDFTKSKSVQTLNKALLKHHYGVANWAIPLGYLCPPVPSRAEYIHHIADILTEENIVP